MIVPAELDGANLTQGTARVAPGRRVTSRFLFWALRAESSRQAWDSYCAGATFRALTLEILETCTVALPSTNEQRAIAAFLDRETARIDVMVAKKERLIELLQEKRTALITRAVTKGLDPNVPMKDSGVEWLGRIPRHWKVKRLKHTAPLQGGYAFKSESFGMDGIPVVRMNNLRRGVLDLNEAAQVSEDECLARFALKDGDLLLGMSGSLGETGSLGNYAIVRIEDLPCQLNQRVGRFETFYGCLKGFVLCFIASAPFTEPLLSESTGTAQFNISPESVGQVRIALPPVEEQERITSFLAAENDKVDALLIKVRNVIDRLKEYRTALISAAVTGKIDVRGAAT